MIRGPKRPPFAEPAPPVAGDVVYVIDDDESVRRSLERLLRSAGLAAETFPSAQAFLDRELPDRTVCVVLDVRMPGPSGLDLQAALAEAGRIVPIIFLTGHGNVPMSVQAMKGGAVDFLQKPIDEQQLLTAVERALERGRVARAEQAERALIQRRYDTLTPRERQVLGLVVTGLLNKQIAANLGAAEKTIKIHRGRVMRKMEAASVADLVRMSQRLAIVLAMATMLLLMPARAVAQTVGEVFKRVSASVVVVRARGQEVTTAGAGSFTETGSGVLVSSDGSVMTAAHVVHAMNEVTVEFMGGEKVAARVVASEPAADLSLLKLDRVPAGARPATLANSDQVQVGDQVIVVGAPYGLSYSLTVGWISARWPANTVYRAMPLAEFFQTDAVINTGNSGGPMFNLAGEVIGIVSHNISKSGGSEGLGFVVTGNTARRLLLERRSVWTGLEGHVLTEKQADILNLPPPSLGYLVKVVAKGSPAEALGLRGGTTTIVIGGETLVAGGDIILSVHGIQLLKLADLVKIREAMNALKPGQPYKASVLRGGKVVELSGHAP